MIKNVITVKQDAIGGDIDEKETEDHDQCACGTGLCGNLFYSDSRKFHYGRRIREASLYDIPFFLIVPAYMAQGLHTRSGAFGMGASDREYELSSAARAYA